MKILQISTYDIKGGAARAAYRLHRGLRELGHDCRMAVRHKDTTDDAVLRIGPRPGRREDDRAFFLDVVIQGEYIDSHRTEISNTMFSLPYPGYDLSRLSVVREADVVNLHWVARYQSPLTLRRLFDLGKPVIWTLHDQWPFTGGCHYAAGCDKYQGDCHGCPQLSDDPFGLPEAVLKDKASFFKDAGLTIVTPSRWMGTCARDSRLFGDLRVEVIANSLEIDIFTPIPKKEAKARLGISSEAFTLLFGAEYGTEKRKGFLELRTAIASCLEDPAFRDLVRRDKIKMICFGIPGENLSSIGIPVMSLGYLKSDEEVSLAYSAADIFVQASLEDNLPNTLLESMSCGTPVVAFDVGGMPDVVENGATGRLVPFGDTLAMGHGLRALLLDADRRETMGKECRRRMEKGYSLGVQARNYLQLYNELVEARQWHRNRVATGSGQDAAEKDPSAVASGSLSAPLEPGVGIHFNAVYADIVSKASREFAPYAYVKWQTAETDRDARLAVIGSQSERISGLESEVDRWLGETRRLQEAHRLVEAERNELKSYTEHLCRQIEGIEAERNELRRYMEDAYQQIETIEADRAARLDVIEAQTARITELESAIGRRFWGKRRLQALMSMEPERNKLGIYADHLRSQIEAIEADRAARLEVIESQGARISELESEVDRWLGETKRLQGNREQRRMGSTEFNSALHVVPREARECDKATKGEPTGGPARKQVENKLPGSPLAPNGRWHGSSVPVKTEGFTFLILNGDLPVFPGWGGIEFLHTTCLTQLARKVGLVSMVHTLEQASKERLLADAGVSLFLWENPNAGQPPQENSRKTPVWRRFAKMMYTLGRAWPARPYDTLFQDLQFSTMSGPVLKALNENIWDALIVVQSTCAAWMDYLPRFPIRVLVMHDVRARVYARRARIARSLAHKTNYLLQSYLYRRFERRYSSKYDLIVTVSSSDEAWVRKYYQPRNIVTIPIPVDKTYFAPMPDETVVPSRILFTGMMNHPPNVDAACFFARDVFPRVKAAIPDAEFWIVGRDPAPEVQALSTRPDVVVTGLVPDIRPYKASAWVEVVPLRFGAGMRQKILEAWSMEKCVVSTTIGAEGLNYQDGVHLLIADDPGTMAEKVIMALQDPDLVHQVGKAGKALALQQHSPSVLSRTYYDAMASLVREKRENGSVLDTVVDLRWMLPGRAGGIENLARSFIKELVRQDAFNQYTLLVPSVAKYDFDLRRNTNITVSVADGPGYYRRLLLWRGAQKFHRLFRINYWRSAEVQALQNGRDLNADVCLSLSGYIYPDMLPLRNIVLVPDLQHEYHPEFFSKHVLEERRRVFEHGITHANYLIAISDYTRQTVIERFHIDPGKIKTIYLSADAVFHRDNRIRGNKERVLSKYQLPDKGYLFFPGNTWPHKNHKGAIEALHLLHREYGHDVPLVCTGSRKEAHGDLLRFIEKSGLENAVKFLGYCPLNDLVGLYEGAVALVYPSLFEGFGIPLLEAMCCDCPIVCSNLTSLPEVAGDAALLVNPHSSEELASAIDRVLTDEDLRRKLISSGREQAARFSWSRFTREVIKVLHQSRFRN
jgi:glycosyltransferase involved in cell wall biosynthesis